MKGMALKQSGFTIIELIMVIVILSILGVAGADFISVAFRGFANTSDRLELYEEGKAALVRMEKELHNAVPNAVCVVGPGGNCLPAGSPGQELRFGIIADHTMAANGLFGKYTETSAELMAAPDQITDRNGVGAPVGSVVSVYNTAWADFNSGARLYGVNSVDIDGTMTLSAPMVSFSPRQRYYLVNRAISYKWDSSTGVLSRSIKQVGAGGVGNFVNPRFPAARGVSDFRVYYSEPSATRDGIVSVLFTLSRNGENINMHKEFHIKNVP